MAKLTAAFAYVRMSTDEQEDSPEQQRREIKKYAKDHGYRIVRWYDDLGISGDRTDKRVGFQRMINDASGGDAEAILCWDQERFGRFDMIEAGYWIEPLRKAGVFLDTCADGIVDWSDMASRLTYSVKQEAKHDLCKSISRNVTRVFEQYAKDGKWAGAAPPYGYVVGPDRKLHKGSPDVIRTVEQIFRKYASGHTPRAIVNWLRESGIDSPRGKGWTTQQIREMIANERYLGRAIYNQRSKSKYKNGSGRTGKRRKLDRSEWTIVDNAHPAIISLELFGRANAQRKGNKKRTAPGATSPLSGIVRCKACGYGMTRHISNGRPTYVCYSYDARGECERYAIPEAVILRTVADVLRREYFGKFTGEANKQKVLAAFRKELEGDRANARVMEAHLSKLQNQISQAETRMLEVPSDMVARVVARIRELENERDALMVQLADAKRPTADLATSLEKRLDAAAAWLDDFDTMLEAGASGDEINRALVQVVEKVELEIDRKPVPPNGIRHTNSLTGGIITLSNTGFLPNVDLQGLGIRSLQDDTVLKIPFGVCA